MSILEDLKLLAPTYSEQLKVYNGQVYIPSLGHYYQAGDESSEILGFITSLAHISHTFIKSHRDDFGYEVIVTRTDDQAFSARHATSLIKAFTKVLVASASYNSYKPEPTIGLFNNLVVLSETFPEVRVTRDSSNEPTRATLGSMTIIQEYPEGTGLQAHMLLKELIDLAYKYNKIIVLTYENENFSAEVHTRNDRVGFGGSPVSLAAALAMALARITRGYYCD